MSIILTKQPIHTTTVYDNKEDAPQKYQQAIKFHKFTTSSNTDQFLPRDARSASAVLLS